MVGVAHSTQPFTGYVAEKKPLVCPTKGDRWALDADVTQGAGGAVWMTWRDGQRAQGPESALSAMRLKFGRNGNVDPGSRPGSSCAATASPGRTTRRATQA